MSETAKRAVPRAGKTATCACCADFAVFAALGAAWVALGAMTGCAVPVDDATEVIVEDDPELRPAPDWDDYRHAARAAGGNSGYYVVENDLVFHDEQALRAHYEKLHEPVDKLAVIQRISNGEEPVFRGTDALRLRYCVSDNFDTQKNTVISAMAEATRSWERVANVRFSYVSNQDAATSCVADNPNVELAVRRFPGFSFGIIACATNKLMWSPYRESCLGPGALGMVSPSAIESLAAPKENVTTVGTLRHELGHFLGFRHEHPWAPFEGGCDEDPTDLLTDITGRRLTPYDQVSVMHYLDCGGVAGIDYTLSTQDGIGARKIYGMPASWHVALQGVSAFL